MRASIEHGTSFVNRLATAFVEVALAAAVIVGAIVAGHDLRAWREWYPTSYHPWIDAPRPAPDVDVSH